MKIAVLMLSRDHPRQMSMVISAYHHLATDRNEIVYAVGCDDDDSVTIFEASMLAEELPVELVRAAPRPPGLGQIVNDLAARIEADVYVPTCDDHLPITKGWDAVVANAMQADVAWWRTAENHDPVFPVVSNRYYEASGRVWTPYFPYWFDDIWLYEVSTMVFARNPLWLNCMMAGTWERSPTRGMVDLGFWTEFFVKTRPERLSEARNIRKKLGLKDDDHTQAICDAFGKNDAARLARVPELEKLYGMGTAPTSYDEARKAAEEILSA